VLQLRGSGLYHKYSFRHNYRKIAISYSSGKVAFPHASIHPFEPWHRKTTCSVVRIFLCEEEALLAGPRLATEVPVNTGAQLGPPTTLVSKNRNQNLVRFEPPMFGRHLLVSKSDAAQLLELDFRRPQLCRSGCVFG